MQQAKSVLRTAARSALTVFREGMRHAEIPILLVVIALAIYVHGLGQTLPSEVGGQHVNIVPAEVGADWSVADFCNDPATMVSPPTKAPDGPNTVYHAVRGANEEVVWAEIDSSGSKQSGAMYYYIDANGVQHGQAVTVTQAAETCILGKAGK